MTSPRENPPPFPRLRADIRLRKNAWGLGRTKWLHCLQIVHFHIVAESSSYTLRSIVPTANKEIRQCIKRSLVEVKNERKLLKCQSRKVAAVTYRRWSFTSGSWMGKLWCFGRLRWSLTRGGCKWRFDWVFSSLRSKRFCLVSEQRKTEERGFRFRPREKWNESQKNERGGRGRGRNLSSPLPPRSFTGPIFHAVFDSRSSVFAPKPHGKACYAGYIFSDVTVIALPVPLHGHRTYFFPSSRLDWWCKVWV